MEEKIIKIMQLVQIKKDNTVEFPEEAKKLIHEAAEKCRKLPIYKDNIDKVDTYKADITAGEIYLDMCLITAVDLLIADLDNLDESDWIRVNDEMPVERDSMFAKFKGTDKWKTGMFEKVSRDVLVTVEYDNGERHTEVAHTVDGRWKLEMRILNAKVIAWKEKPQPYKGDKNVSNM